MTEYQKIEKELTALGWAGEQGSGDHIKFTKEGNPHKIIVALSLSAEARAIKNTYADIRRIEPRFPLGRQPHMLPGAQGDRAESCTIPEEVPEWMYPDRPVRWTGPEGRDWSKLADPASVMNRKYVVTDYQQTSDGLMVLIRDTHDEATEPFAVFQEELDMWATLQCTRCHKDMPKNWFVTGKDNKLYCEDCHQEMILEQAVAIPEPEEEKTPCIPGAPKELLQALQDLAKINETNEDDAYTVEYVEARKRLETKAREMWKDLPTKARKSIRKFYPETKFLDEAPDAPKPTTPYAAWKQCVEDIANHHMAINAFTPSKQRELYKKTHAMLWQSTYSTKYLFSKENRRKKAAAVITIGTKDWDTAYIIWCHVELVYAKFEEVIPDYPVFVLLQCQKAGFKQYILNIRRDFDKQLSILEALLPNPDDGSLERMRLNRYLPDAKQVYDKITAPLSAIGLENGKEIGIFLHPDIAEDSHENFEKAEPLYDVTIVPDLGIEDGKYNEILSLFKDNASFDIPLRVTVVNYGKEIKETFLFRGDFPEGVFDARGTDEADEGVILMSILGKTGPDERYCIQTHAEYEPAQEKDWIRDVSGALAHTAARKTSFREVLKETLRTLRKDSESDLPALDAYNDIVSDIIPKETDNKTTHTMNDKDILDSFNPESPFPFLATASTRDLLKELKLRGVEFKDLTITVRKSINMDEI